MRAAMSESDLTRGGAPTEMHGWVPGFARDGSPLDAAAVTERRDAFLRAALDQLPARIS